MSDTTIVLQNCLDRLRNGDLSARDELVEKVSQRLLIMSRRMIQKNPRLARWEQEDDLFQQTQIRLHQALTKVVPPTAEEFLFFAAFQLRRELYDMARHYFGPLGLATRHDSRGHQTLASHPQANISQPEIPDAQNLAIWTEVHQAVEQLPERERQVFDLLWYHELSAKEAADILQVSDRQVRRYWHSARLKLYKLLGDSDIF